METLQELFLQWSGQETVHCLAMGSSSASSRRYYRLTTGGTTPVSAIGCIASDIDENEAFFSFTGQLAERGVRVPQLYAVASDRRHYLQQDLGDTSLYDILRANRQQGRGVDKHILHLYRQALSDLADMQRVAADIDFSRAYPIADFGKQAIAWDLNYFKYNFLKLASIPFNEARLEDDFETLATLALEANTSYFLYRDFNPRNIMVKDDVLYYIDYQGARRGAAQYDVVSLLYSTSSDLPQPIRDELLRHYLDYRGIEGQQRDLWLRHFQAYRLLRLLQNLGAYGYRGIFQGKPYFLQSIPQALDNLRHLLYQRLLPPLPEIEHLATLDATSHIPLPTSHVPLSTSDIPLTVTLLSFSYKQGLPPDPTGNGGGFVFDCRALPNPGRYDQYKAYTGRDATVIEFLQREEAVGSFLDHVKGILSQSVQKYLSRHFTHLQVAFGCTGGQHRSVYCTEQIAQWLHDNYPVAVHVQHIEQKIAFDL